MSLAVEQSAYYEAAKDGLHLGFPHKSKTIESISVLLSHCLSTLLSSQQSLLLQE